MTIARRRLAGVLCAATVAGLVPAAAAAASSHGTAGSSGGRQRVAWSATSATPAAGAPGRSVTVTGELTAASNRRSMPGQPVDLMASAGGGAWQPVSFGTTGDGGGVTFTETPQSSTAYRLMFEGQGSYAAGASAVMATTVTPVVTLAQSGGAATAGQRVTFTVAVQPQTSGVPLLTAELVKGRWRNLGRLTTQNGGVGTFSTTFASAGRWKVRVTHTKDKQLTAATSPVLTVQVGRAPAVRRHGHR